MKKFCRENSYIYPLLAIIILFAGCRPAAQKSAADIRLDNNLHDDLKYWPKRLIDDSKDTFLKKENAAALAAAGSVSIAMHNSNADKELSDGVANDPKFHGFADESLNIAGCPGTHAAATAVWYAMASYRDDTLGKNRAWTMMTALAITDATTLSLKLARNNDCPNGSPLAWPSGHTSSSFTVASVLDEFYGPGVGIPAYAAASLIAYRMVDTGDHWTSDVIFCATLGWVVGHTVAGKHKALEVAGFSILPYTYSNSGPAIGLNFVKTF